MDTSTDGVERPIDVKDYNPMNGKLNASVRWLIARIYEEADVPDILHELFAKDEHGILHPLPPVAASLADGTFYKQAASKIFHDPSLVTATVGSVLRALSSAGIEVRESDGMHVTEATLMVDSPLRVQSHLALLDGLMAAHIKNVISVEAAVQAISTYTPVAAKEEPLDCVDALLFWVNKICLLVRDDVERSGIVLKSNSSQAEGATIPEMEDLYEDLCDGTCICTVLHFYRPDAVPLREIYFNDPMSVNDCRFNLDILKNFCEHSLPWSPFHFDIEDILYLHESLQPNINVFLAELFNFLEPSGQAGSLEPAPASTQKRFVPVGGIPELRSRNIAARPAHPPSKFNRYSCVTGQLNGERPSSTIASMNSMDSLIANSALTKMPEFPPNALVTSFGQLQTEASSTHQQLAGIDQQQRTQTQQPHHKSSLEIRLQMEELRRQWECNKQMQEALNEERKNKAGKDAFFRVMSKSSHDADSHDKQITAVVSKDENVQQRPADEVLNAQVRSLQEQIDQLKMASQQNLASQLHLNAAAAPTGQLPYMPDPRMYASSQSLVANPYVPGQVPMQQPVAHQPQGFAFVQPGNYAPQPPHYLPGVPPLGIAPTTSSHFQTQDSQYAALPFPPPSDPHQLYQAQMHYSPQQPLVAGAQPPMSMYQTAGYLNSSYRQPISATQQQFPAAGMGTPFGYTQPLQPFSFQQQGAGLPPTALSPSSSQHNGLNFAAANEAPTSFRLHEPNASSSRLDPQLELNRNLTNWGLTYRADDRPPRKTWETTAGHGFIGGSAPVNEQHNTEGTIGPAGSPTLTNSTEGGKRSDHSASSHNTRGGDESARTPSHGGGINQSTVCADSDLVRSAPGGVVLHDITEANPEMTPEMQAKKRALLVSQMRRKEKNAVQNEEKEASELMRKKHDMEKQEQMEQRKADREMRRQKLLDDYRRRKMEQDLGGELSPHTARLGSTTSLNRGHSQPPFQRPKSQSNMSLIQSQTLQRNIRAQSNMGNEEGTPLTTRIHVPSIAEPTLRLFAKQHPKSNRSLIMNALQYSIFPGSVSSEQKMKVLGALAQSDSKHFLVLFRDNKCQYRGLYTWDQIGDTAFRIDGTGPKVCRESMMCFMFKYDSGSKAFSIIPTRHLSVTIDGFAIADQYWQKKVPYSAAR